jgi:hypothetical protein
MDYSNMSVTPVMLADLGFFSEALGTAELLANGDYHFEAGYGIGPPTYAEAIEVFPNSTLSLTMKLHGFPCYRSFRMTDLYTPPDKD